MSDVGNSRTEFVPDLSLGAPKFFPGAVNQRIFFAFFLRFFAAILG